MPFFLVTAMQILACYGEHLDKYSSPFCPLLPLPIAPYLFPSLPTPSCPSLPSFPFLPLLAQPFSSPFLIPFPLIMARGSWGAYSSQLKICRSVKSFTHVHRMPIQHSYKLWLLVNYVHVTIQSSFGTWGPCIRGPPGLGPPWTTPLWCHCWPRDNYVALALRKKVLTLAS